METPTIWQTVSSQGHRRRDTPSSASTAPPARWQAAWRATAAAWTGDCVLKDDFDQVRPRLIEADMVVFVTPMYYFGFSAQLKNVIDRFYAINGRIKGAPKKTAFLMAYADTNPKEAEAMLLHYRTLADYLGWENMGTVVAPGVWTAGSIRNTRYGDDAYKLGKNL